MLCACVCVEWFACQIMILMSYWFFEVSPKSLSKVNNCCNFPTQIRTRNVQQFCHSCLEGAEFSSRKAGKNGWWIITVKSRNSSSLVDIWLRVSSVVSETKGQQNIEINLLQGYQGFLFNPWRPVSPRRQLRVFSFRQIRRRSTSTWKSRSSGRSTSVCRRRCRTWSSEGAACQKTSPGTYCCCRDAEYAPKGKNQNLHQIKGGTRKREGGSRGVIVLRWNPFRGLRQYFASQEHTYTYTRIMFAYHI